MPVGKVGLAWVYLIAVAVCMSCQPQLLSVRLDAVTPAALASYHVARSSEAGQLCHDLHGQKLTISWALPYQQPLADMHLVLTIRYGNHIQKQKKLRLKRRCGFYVFELLNEQFYRLAGIQTYKVELWDAKQCLASCHHALWKEWISVGED